MKLRIVLSILIAALYPSQWVWGSDFLSLPQSESTISRNVEVGGGLVESEPLVPTVLGIEYWEQHSRLVAPKFHMSDSLREEIYRFAFFNMENLFDTWRDSLHNDEEFTPQGSRHWTHKRLSDKMNLFWKMVAAMSQDDISVVHYPAIIGLVEVENEWVLQTLCRSYPLGRRYQWIHFESPDIRGVDCAMLYDSTRFVPFSAYPIRVSDSASAFYTRDILSVGGVMTASGDTAFFFVCHFPSRLGGVRAERHRQKIALLLRHSMDSLSFLHPNALVMAMGDFNCGPRSTAMQILADDSVVCNLMATLPRGDGTHYYRGYWDYLDQFLYSRNKSPLQPLQATVFRHPSLLIDDPRHQGSKPRRTFLGYRYQGGLSDHLPIYVDCKRLVDHR